MTPSFTSIAVSLFLIFNAIGCVPLFMSLLGHFSPERQRKIVLREMSVALGVLLLFTFFGKTILNLIGISQPVVGIGGGILLFIISLGMIFPKEEKNIAAREEPMIIPLAVPLIAGPGMISAVMVYAEKGGNVFIVGSALLLAWIPSVCILLLASNIKYLLGEKTLSGLAKFGGMLLSLIAIQMLTQGMISLVKTHF